MAKRVKLGIMRARHDPNVPYISDAACIAMMMSNPASRAVLDYWAFVTDGYLDFRDTALMPWVDITLTAGDTGRNTQLAKAYAATAALPNAVMDGFDGWAVLTLPGTVTIANPAAGQPGQPAVIEAGIDGGTGSLPNGQAGAALPVMSSDHTFMCHEIGHVLGFKHTYGVWNNGIDWDGIAPFDQGQVYGDPFDIMSSATFGTRSLDPTMTRYFGNPTFPGPAVDGWPNTGAFTMGPEPARAHVHLWDPAAVPAGTVRNVHTPVGNEVVRVNLVAAGRHGRAGQLAVIHPLGEDPQGRGRCYIEYRERINWDQGLDLSGGDLARQAVVVHTLADSTGDGVRCWYRGHIVVPLETDTDLTVEGTPYVVRVLDFDADTGRVELEISLSAPRTVYVDKQNYETLLAESDPRPMSTPCGERIVSASRTWQTTTHLHPSTRGYGGHGTPGVVSPVIRWTVGGTPIGPGDGAVSVPTEDGVFTVQYELNAATAVLVLVGRGGEKYTTEVVCTATEADGSNAVSRTEVFDPVGWTKGFTPADLAKLDDCMAERFQEVRIRPRDWFVEPEPDPLRFGVRDQINEMRLRAMADAVEGANPEVAIDLRRIADLRFQQFG
jgi:hypothetical protein